MAGLFDVEKKPSGVPRLVAGNRVPPTPFDHFDSET